MAAISQINGTLTGQVVEDGQLVTTGRLKVAGEVVATGFLAYSQSSAYGAFTLLADGTWTYSLSNGVASVQGLAAGEMVADQYTVTWFDDAGGPNLGVVSVDVLGRNDVPVVTGDTLKSLNTDSQNHLSGVLAISDADDGEKSFFAVGSLVGNYGSFSLNTNGTWSYTLSPTANLSATPLSDEVFAIHSADGTASSVKVLLSGHGAANQFTQITGTTANDVLTSSTANEQINGLAGTDTVVYDGAVSQYVIQLNRAAHTVTVSDNQSGRDGTDYLSNVEKLQFGGQSFDLFNPGLTQVPAYGRSGSFLFDSSYYLLSHPELAATLSLETAPGHYLSTGAALGYEPNTWFDPVYYENRWADLKSAHLDDATLFMHYNLYGVWEGRSAGPAFDRFDGERYLRDNPDVAAYVDAYIGDFLGSRTNGAIAHYIIYGANEGRVAYDNAGGAVDMTVLVGVPV